MKAMNAILICVVTILTLTAASCPTKPDPYAIARDSIAIGHLAADFAETGFNLWCPHTADNCAAARPKFEQIRLDFLNALSVATAAIDLAQSQSTGFNLAALLGPAEALYQNLLKFLADLGVTIPGSVPTTLPTIKQAPPVNTLLVNKLPKTILPPK